jgi:periplasmic protein TonB
MKIIMVLVAFSLGPILAQQDDTIYKPGNGVSLPTLVTEVRPNYTADAMRRRVSGAVLLQCVVDREGVPTNIEVVQSLDESLDEVALKALRQWRFEPGKKDGKAVSVQIDVKMAFTMVAKRKRWWWPLA